MKALAVERTCAAADLERQTEKEIHRLQRQMQSGRPLVDTVNDVYVLHANVTLARLRLDLAADRLAGRAAIASSTRRLGQVRHIPSASTIIRPQDLW